MKDGLLKVWDVEKTPGARGFQPFASRWKLHSSSTPTGGALLAACPASVLLLNERRFEGWDVSCAEAAALAGGRDQVACRWLPTGQLPVAKEASERRSRPKAAAKASAPMGSVPKAALGRAGLLSRRTSPHC